MAQQIVIEVPGTKISELEKASSISRNDVTPVVQDDETKQAEIGQIADLVISELGSAALKMNLILQHLLLLLKQRQQVKLEMMLKMSELIVWSMA
ncbi:hypothetical protein MKR65_13190 [Acinetobacter baumannii]